MRFLANVAFVLASCATAACQSAPGIAPAASARLPLRQNDLNGINLYVANTGGKTSSSGAVTMYGLAHGRLLGTIADGVDRPSAVSYDAAANLMAVANTLPTHGAASGSVSLYAPGSTTPTNVLKGTADPVALASDSAGNVYVANFKAGVNVYAPDRSRPIRIIPGNGDDYNGVYAPRLLALDPSGNLYVANGPVPVGSQDSVFALAVFPPGGTQSSMIYQIGFPLALLVARNHLYIAYGSIKSGPNPHGTIVVYPLGSYVPSDTIKQGLDRPDGLAIDASGNLYVANLNGQNVAVYRAGGTAPFRTITSGVHFPRALAIGPEGNLYVSNLYANTVTVYKPGQQSPFLTIAQSVNDPVSLALNAP